MITNNSITYYHKDIDEEDKIETWEKTYFDKVWEFGTAGSTTNEGIAESNQINVRIPMSSVEDVSLFNIGDIIAIGEQNDITTQQDLESIEHYVITRVTINNFGNNPHVHLVGG